MAYLTRAALQQRVGGKVQYLSLLDARDTSLIDTNLEALFLAQVDAEVDGYARRGGYTTPLTTENSDSILTYLLDISNYKMKSRGDRQPSQADELLYKDAMKVMEMIANGTWVFPSGPPSSVGGVAFGMDSEDQVFTRTLLRDL